MKRVIVTYGRFNPPHVGHGHVFRQMKTHSEKNHDSYIIGISGSEDFYQNPLRFREKLKILYEMFPEHENHFLDISMMGFINFIKLIDTMGYDELIIYCGSDRFQEFSVLSEYYNGTEYNFDKIEVVNSGDRDKNDLISKMSSTKMRNAVRHRDFKLFLDCLPKEYNEESAKKLFDIIDKRLK